MNIKKQIKAEIERLIGMNKTKNGFPAGTMCAFRIEAYEKLLSFINSLPEEKPSEDLEQAAWEYASKECEKDAFKAGARWQKEQMLKEAVNGEVVKTLGGSLRVSSYIFKRDGFEFGDKVKIIIVKED